MKKCRLLLLDTTFHAVALTISELAIDSPKLSTQPFCKNWYYWSEDIQLG